MPTVTGPPVTPHGAESQKLAARQVFPREWDHGIYFGSLIGGDKLAALSTNMGHAEYAQEGRNFNSDNRVLSFGSKPDIRAEVERYLAAGKRSPGSFLCISGRIPPNVPVVNAL